MVPKSHSINWIRLLTDWTFDPGSIVTSKYAPLFNPSHWQRPPAISEAIHLFGRNLNPRTGQNVFPIFQVWQTWTLQFLRCNRIHSWWHLLPDQQLGANRGVFECADWQGHQQHPHLLIGWGNETSQGRPNRGVICRWKVGLSWICQWP